MALLRKIFSFFSGDPKEVDELRECLDTGQPFPSPINIHSMAECLLLFLSSLADPVIPQTNYFTILEQSGSYLKCKQLIQSLPPVNRNVFCYIIAFLRELLKYSFHNKLTPRQIALLFGGTLIRNETHPVNTILKSLNTESPVTLQKAQFIFQFLSVSDNEISQLSI